MSSIMGEYKSSAEKIMEKNTPKTEPKKESTPTKDTAKDKQDTAEKVRFNAILPETLYEQMRETSYQSRESMNKIVIKALEQYFKRSK